MYSECSGPSQLTHTGQRPMVSKSASCTSWATRPATYCSPSGHCSAHQVRCDIASSSAETASGVARRRVSRSASTSARAEKISEASTCPILPRAPFGGACGLMTRAAVNVRGCALGICKSWSYIPAFAWLILITILSSASSFNGNIPFDQRTGQPFVDAAMVMPFWGSVIEPFSAIFHMILGASNYQITIISSACWLFAGSATVAFIAQWRRPQQSHYVKIFHILTFVWGSVILFTWYLVFALLVPLPSSSLVLKDPAAIVADLHSHTIASHDAIISEQQNLAIHRDRGYGVVAWAEHYPAPWRSTISAADRTKGTSPMVIPGLEISISIDDRNYHLVLLNIRPGCADIETWVPKLIDDRALRSFTAMIHAAHGVVVAVNFKLNEKDIDRLVADGVDAFEIANLGHPWISPALHAAMVKAQGTTWHRLDCGFRLARLGRIFQNLDCCHFRRSKSKSRG